MKIKHFNTICAAVLAMMLGATVNLHAQGRGGGGGGAGGFGGFGGGGGGAGGGGASSSSAVQYNSSGKVGSAMISVDPETHSLVVIADDATRLQISNVLKNLDMPKPQVLIKVVFMELNRNSSSEIGLSGAYTRGLGNSSSTGSVAQVLGNMAGVGSIVTNFTGMGTPLGKTSTSPAGGIYQIVGSDYQATLKMIAQNGKAQILSRPSVLARDGQLAEIVVGQSIYLPSGVSFTSSGNTTTPIINGNYTDVGIILDVTPFIGNNNLVEMILAPKITAIDNSTPGQVIAAAGNLISTPIYAPNITTRSANTVVITPDRQPVVIGGLIGAAQSASVSKIPFLGDIPFLGKLFQSNAKADAKTELLIFLTPSIVRAPGTLGAFSDEEARKSQIITNGFSEQELNQYLDRVPMKK
jgi:type II secretory pathway component GspD/PulD (secretin)